MKTKYVSPKAEKLEFDYKQSVVASQSGIGCMPQTVTYWSGESSSAGGCRQMSTHNSGDM